MIPKLTHWIALFFASLGVFGLCAAEPVYEGKSTDFWLDHFFTPPNGMEETVTAFKAMGSNSVPFLVEVLERKPSGIGEAVDNALYKQDLARRVPQSVIKTLPSAMQTEDRREHAAFLLGQIGPDAEAAIPMLMTVLTNQSEGWRIVAECRGALLAMGEKLAGQVPCFITFLRSQDRRVQQMGAVLLASTGPKARAALPDLLALSEDPGSSVSLSVATALWNIDRQTNVVLRVYSNCLASSNSTFQQLALVHLRDLGTAAEPAGPAVQKFLMNPDSVLRRDAEVTLSAIAPNLLRQTGENLNRDIPSQVANMIQVLKTGTFQDRFRVLESIWVLGPDAEAAVPALIDVLNEPAPELPGAFSLVGQGNSRRCAAQALGEIGPGARAALPALIRLLNEHKDGNGAIYCRALGWIGQETKESVSALELALRDDNRGVRLAAAIALTRLVPDRSTNAVTVLRGLQTDPELATVWVVNTNGIAERSEKKDFDNPSSRFFRLAASVPLWRLGLEKDPPVAGILQAIKERGSSDEISYIEMLGDIGADAKSALPRLETSLGQNNPIKWRQAAAIAIRKIDPAEAAKLGLPGILLVP